MSRHCYGEHLAQFGELTRPTGDSRGTVVIVHGGFWRARYDLSLGRPLARDLAARGYACWNLEYRRVGDGGGWPTTLQDVADGIDLLATLDVDTSAVTAIGHSAGGHLVAWAAARPLLPAGAPGADPAVALSAAISQAGVLDLTTAARTGLGAGAVIDLLGGTPETVPDRYRLADPCLLGPPPVPVACVHAPADDIVPYAQSEAYLAAAGDRARLVAVPGDHFTVIDPASAAWQAVVTALAGSA